MFLAFLVATAKGASIKQGIALRLESIRDILHIVFRDGSKSHAKYYNVSWSFQHNMFVVILFLFSNEWFFLFWVLIILLLNF